MTDYWFGGDQASYVVSVGVGNDVVFEPGAEVKAWTDRTAGEQITALADETAAPITVVRASDGTDTYPLGGLPRFKAPQPAIWLGEDGKPRVLALTTDLPDMIAAVSALAGQLDDSLDFHTSQRNGHSTGVADLADVAVPPAEQRTAGQVFGVVTGGSFGLLSPSQAAGALLLDPRDGNGTYVGQTVPPPDPSSGQGGPSWFRMQATYAPNDDLPDMFQLGSTTAGGTWILTGRYNGNGEGRDSPSDPDRVARRVFEMLESLGGPSKKTFFELSTNPANPALREKLFAAYGTAHASMPGWMVATRILWAQRGVQAGGSYNALTAVNIRGRSASAGAPTAGVWTAGDLVIDTNGAPWLCTATGEPGTWVGAGSTPPSSFVDLTAGANMTQGAKKAASRLDRGGETGRLRGFLTASGAVAAGDTIATITTAGHRPSSTVTTIARYSGGGSKIDISPAGVITLGSALSAGQSVWLDSITYDLLA